MSTIDEPAAINGIPIARSIALRGVQRMVARRMVESRATTASVTAMAQVDATQLTRTLDRLRAEVPELSLTHLLIQATALCLRHHPRLNATMVDDTIHELAEINLSIALALPSQDLYTVTIRGADTKPLVTIAHELQALRDRAATGKLTLEDVRGGTFTLSNYGMLRNVVWATPIITPGQTAVLGIARIMPQLVAAEGGYVPRPVLPFSLTYDHRIVNGVPAGQFLDDLAETLSTDSWIVLHGGVA